MVELIEVRIATTLHFSHEWIKATSQTRKLIWFHLFVIPHDIPPYHLLRKPESPGVMGNIKWLAEDMRSADVGVASWVQFDWLLEVVRKCNIYHTARATPRFDGYIKATSSANSYTDRSRGPACLAVLFPVRQHSRHVSSDNLVSSDDWVSWSA